MNIFAILLTALFLLSTSAPTLGDDRMAGASTKPSTPSTHNQQKPFDLASLESSGLLNNLKDGGLGIDLWRHSQRHDVLSFIPTIPAQNTYKILQDLTYRALTSKADAGIMENRNSRKIEKGSDLLTLRIEKLTEAGYLSEAAKLYAQNPHPPYHERLAQAGVTAMLYNQKIALACLETKAFQDRFTNTVFWSSLSRLCGYTLGDMAGQKPSGNALTDVSDSSLLQKMMTKKTFRFSPRSMEDIEQLDIFEKAFLFANQKVSYEKLQSSDFKNVSPLITTLLLNDQTLPDEYRYQLLVQSVADGRKKTDDLVAFYNQAKTPDHYKKVKDWQRTPYLYKKIQSANPDDITKAVKEILNPKEKFNPVSLLPFVQYMRDTSPETLSYQAIRTAVRVFTIASEEMPSSWQKKWEIFLNEKKEIQQSDLFLTLAYEISTGFSTDMGLTVILNDKDFSFYNKGLRENDTDLIYISYEKLDNQAKLHNYDRENAYGNPEGLTLVDDYVMPSIDLMSGLEKAYKKESLGEIVLLSSIALQSIPPEKFYAGLMSEILDGFNTVGLTNEARELAKEVVLGLSN